MFASLPEKGRAVGALIHYAHLVPHDDRSGRNELGPLQGVVSFGILQTSHAHLCAGVTQGIFH